MLLAHDLHGPAGLAPVHALEPNQLRGPADTPEIDVGLTITEDVHVNRLMIIGEDDHPQIAGTQDGDRCCG